MSEATKFKDGDWIDNRSYYKQLVRKYANGRGICNCGDAYYNDEGRCEWGCGSAQITTRNEIAFRVLKECEEKDETIKRLNGVISGLDNDVRDGNIEIVKQRGVIEGLKGELAEAIRGREYWSKEATDMAALHSKRYEWEGKK